MTPKKYFIDVFFVISYFKISQLAQNYDTLFSMQKYIDRLSKSIRIVFYFLFLTTPLAMHPNTSELFELNKMWLVYIYSIIILFLWGTKILLEKKFEVRRTPFDIFLLLFLSSQLLSTIFSLDPHTSFWGYYSRFNGGLLSTLCYIFLYFAFSTNVLSKDFEESVIRVKNILAAIVISGVMVALWGLPSHFGYDPTCLVFRGSLDVECWTSAFQPKVRMFSTLGQPNWLAAFLMILIPISTAFTINFAKKISLNQLLSNDGLKALGFGLATILFYLDLVWTLSQSGFIGFWVGNFIFSITFLALVLRKNSFSLVKTFKERGVQVLVGLQIIFLLITFLTTNPIPSLQNYNLNAIINSSKITTQPVTPTESSNPKIPQKSEAASQPALEGSITGSGEIRKIVWKGAIEIWKANPILGTGVETFAFAYYKHRPAEHNLTSEWDYLYNKAHNEFLNYLATTGALGLGSYLSFLFAFFFYAGKTLLKSFKSKEIGDTLLPAFVGSFVGIQISNFFGFSVVNVNLLMFLIPVFFVGLSMTKDKYFLLSKNLEDENIAINSPGTGRIMVMIGLGVFCFYSIIFLINYWNADIAYGWGYNYNRVNAFQEANPYLEKAVQMRGGEDLYKNELSINLAALALAAAQNQDQNLTTQFATRAKLLSDEVARDNPNNVVYWKTRTRVIFSLAELSPTLLPEAVSAIDKARALAPTDAKILYNQALIYDQAGRKKEALKIIDEAIKLKPNYRDAYYAKALFLSQMAQEDPNNAESYKGKAKEVLNFILESIPNDTQAKDLLNSLN